MDLLDFQSTCKILFAAHSKHSFGPSADIKPVSNDLEHEMLAMHICSLYVFTMITPTKYVML
jgi:hypothetical protein